MIDYSLYSRDLLLAVGWVVFALRGWLGWPCSPSFFSFFIYPFFGLTLPRRWLGGLRIASSSLLSPGHLPSSGIIGLFLSLICYQSTVVRYVSLAGSLFLHNLAIYFGQFVRLHPFSMSNARAILLILQVLISFVVLIIYGGRTCLHLSKGLVFIFYLLLYGVLPYWPSVPTPPSWLFAFWFSCDPISPSLTLLLRFLNREYDICYDCLLSCSPLFSLTPACYLLGFILSGQYDGDLPAYC